MLNLVASFQVLGTLMSLGLVILPAIAARFWVRGIDAAIAMSVLIACVSSVCGLLASYYWALPTGPAVVLVAGAACLFGALFGTQGSLRALTDRG